MNHKQLSKLALALGAMVMAGGAMAQTNASDDAAASATIIAPIELAKETDLAFGNIVANKDTPGTVVLAASLEAARTTPGSIVMLPAVAGTVTAAYFTVTGSGTSAYSITLPVSATLTGAGDDMTVDTFKTNKEDDKSSLVAGEDDFYVGATLNVGIAQAAGVYSGTFPVSVAYD